MYPRMRDPETVFNAAVAAEQVIRAYCGWHVAPVLDEVLVLDGNGERRILLPSRRVVEVDSVSIDDDELDTESYRWSESGWLTRVGGYWPDRERSIRVSIKHGFDQADDVLGVARAVQARAEMSPTGNVISQRAGTQAVSFASSGGAVASLPLLGQEKDTLAPYKLNWGP